METDFRNLADGAIARRGVTCVGRNRSICTRENAAVEELMRFFNSLRAYEHNCLVSLSVGGLWRGSALLGPKVRQSVGKSRLLFRLNRKEKDWGR
jgi:hypothetical protein